MWGWIYVRMLVTNQKSLEYITSHHTFQNLISALASADHVRVTRRQDQGPELTIIASDVKP